MDPILVAGASLVLLLLVGATTVVRHRHDPPAAGVPQSNSQKTQANSSPLPVVSVAACHAPSSIRTSTSAMGSPHAAPMTV